MSDSHNEQKELINRKRLIVYLSIAGFLAGLGVFVQVYGVYVYTSLVTKIWNSALFVVICSVMILSHLLPFLILWALGWLVYLGVNRLFVVAKGLFGKK